jgi:hypothetical protein
MKKYLTQLLYGVILLSASFTSYAQTLQPFPDCPGVNVIVSRPGINATIAPYQIFLVNQTTGAVTPTGNPINLQINGFGLNNADGFLYAMHESSNTTNPFFTRVDRNGAFEDLGTLLPPPTVLPNVGTINTAGGTIDDQGNYYFTAVTFNLQNTSEPPHLFSGKILNVAALTPGTNPINVIYVELGLGTCTAELSTLLMNPQAGALQDFAISPANGQIYTFLPTAGKMARYNPNMTFSFECLDPTSPNPMTADLAGCFFDTGGGSLFILTTDGNLYKGNIAGGTNSVTLITQTALPLLGGNLRGDMASCIGRKKPPPTAFDNCPGASVIVSRPGINATVGPYQIYEVDPPTGNITPTGTPINHEINGFGLNAKDGFLYAMHESTNVNDPFFTRVGKNGSTVDLGKLTPPPATAPSVGIINTAGGTMDPFDNYFFTAVTADNANFAATAQLFMGKIANVSTLVPGSPINVTYVPVALGPCGDEFALQLANPGNGLLQDFAYNPTNDRIYFYVPEQAGSPASGKIGSFNVGNNELMFCLEPHQPNPQLANLAGIFFGPQNVLYILTTDGKYYSGNIFSGVITEVTQTQLPLISGNLRGDMASCVKKVKKHHDYGYVHQDGDGDDDDQGDGEHHFHMGVTPNPVQGGEVVCSIESEKNVQVEMIVVDAYSRIAQRRNIRLSEGNNQMRIDVSHLMKGISSIMLIYPTGRRESIKFIRM